MVREVLEIAVAKTTTGRTTQRSLFLGQFSSFSFRQPNDHELRSDLAVTGEVTASPRTAPRLLCVPVHIVFFRIRAEKHGPIRKEGREGEISHWLAIKAYYIHRPLVEIPPYILVRSDT